MEIAALVSTVVSVVGGWLARRGGRMASKVGEKVGEGIDAALDEKVDKLYEAVRDRLATSARGERVVSALEREPASDGTRVGVETLLEHEAQSDPDFAARLVDLLAQAEEAGATQEFAPPSQTIHGSVRQVGHDSSTQIAQSSGTVNIDHSH